MRISWNWLSELVDLSPFKGPIELAEFLTHRGLEVETIDRLGQGLEQVITAQILEKKPHPQADRLSICLVSVGSGDPLQIVCGAQNMKAGDKVALAQIGAKLPNGLEISQSKIRGIFSYGMLCSEEELKLKEHSEGILLLPPLTALGQSLATFLGRDDTILTLKITANRGDCLSHLGIAREIGSGLQKVPQLPSVESLVFQKCPISIDLSAGDLAPQFFGCWIDNIKVGPSPDWMVNCLEVLGVRSVNNVVDATNWVLLELGHPMHAYDASKIRGSKIQVRLSRPQELLPLLDGITVELTGSEIVVADQERAIALAGVMGGGNSEVQMETQTIFLECAEFDPIAVRRSASRFQRKTDAAHRFERGVNPSGLAFALARLAHLVIQLAGGRIVGAAQAQLPSRSGIVSDRREVKFETYYLNDFLGFPRDQEPLTLEQVKSILEALDCRVEKQDNAWSVCPPSYRLDLNIREDFAEEIARWIGYDRIPSTIPILSSPPGFLGSALPRLTVMDRAKEALVRAGLNETVHLAFTSRSWLSQFQYSSFVQLLNPLSEEYEMLVPSLIPGLVRNALENWHHHFGSELPSIRLFELRPVFSSSSPTIEARSQAETGVIETWKLALGLSGSRFAQALRSERGEVDFYDLKAVLEFLWVELGTKGVRLIPLLNSKSGGHPLFHPGQSVEVWMGSSLAGHFGLFHPAKAKELKMRAPFWIAELDWQVLTQLSRPSAGVPRFQAWPEFPQMERDFALVVKKGVSTEKLCQLAVQVGKPLARTAQVFDIYQGSQVAEGMTSVAVRVIFYHETRSLQESEAESVSARILEAWKKEFGAELRS